MATDDKLTRDLRASIAAIERYRGPQLMTVPSDQLTAVLDEIEALRSFAGDDPAITNLLRWNEEKATRIAALEQENADLRKKVAALSAQATDKSAEIRLLWTALANEVSAARINALTEAVIAARLTKGGQA